MGVTLNTAMNSIFMTAIKDFLSTWMMTTKLLTEQTFLSGRGGVHVHPMHPPPPAYVPDREEFHAELSELTKAVPKHNVLVTGGDMNGKIGASDATGSVYNENTNENGQLLLNYMLECNLKPLKTCFKKREGKLWTHTSPSGAKCPIDYILINNKLKNSEETAKNCEAYNTFYFAGSDHRIVTAKIRLSLRQSKPSGQKKIRYNWNKLLNDNDIKDKYTVEVCNRYQALQDLHGNKDAN